MDAEFQDYPSLLEAMEAKSSTIWWSEKFSGKYMS